MSMSARQQELLALPRWEQLGRVIGWHRDPLVAADGCTPAEIATARDRIGVPLPTVLQEWFEILGHRLWTIQDPAATLDTLHVEGDRITVWSENQAVWSLATPPGDDPVAELDGAPTKAPLSAWLTGLLMSETLVGAWVGEGQGPLGALSRHVRGGGMVEDVSVQELDALRAHHQPLEWPVPASWFTWYGDAETIIRISDGDYLEWFTATPDALARLGRVLDLAAGTTRVVARIHDLTPAEHAHLSEPGGRVLDTTRLHGDADAAVAAFGSLVSTKLRSDPAVAEVHLDTDQPDALCALLIDTLAPTWGDRLTVARRPERMAWLQVLHPAGGQELFGLD
ncbi:MAG: hypothetical protein Q4D96_11760 [Propionibacteriaceae bacterium]|nr:hypothetical protein [Propionibacteriaceae bacterium]